MYIEKLKSGSYRITQKYEGKRYRATVDFKPTPKEALEIITRVLQEETTEKGTFKAACEHYIEIKNGVLSPRTIREYSMYPNRLPEWFCKMSVAKMKSTDVQKCISELSTTMSPKTVRTLHGFISAVLGVAKPNMVLKTTLPKMQKKEPYIPKKEVLAAILKEAEGTQYHIPIQLACYGLRRGEICALDISDIDGNIVHVRKDIVQDSKGNWVKKPPKTPSSVRDVPIDSALAEEIRNQGYVFDGFPGTISNFLSRTQTKLGLEHFSIHKLRHLFASILLDKGYDLKTIQDLGGWQGSETVSKVYLHSLKLREEETRKQIASDISDFLK